MVKENIDLDEMDVIEELHLRIDTLLEILEKKGIMTKKEFEIVFEEKYQ